VPSLPGCVFGLNRIIVRVNMRLQRLYAWVAAVPSRCFPGSNCCCFGRRRTIVRVRAAAAVVYLVEPLGSGVSLAILLVTSSKSLPSLADATGQAAVKPNNCSTYSPGTRLLLPGTLLNLIRTSRPQKQRFYKASTKEFFLFFLLTGVHEYGNLWDIIKQHKGKKDVL